MVSYDTPLDNFARWYKLQGEMAVIENNQIRMERELRDPEELEKVTGDIQEFLDSLDDDERDDHFQNGGGYGD